MTGRLRRLLGEWVPLNSGRVVSYFPDSGIQQGESVLLYPSSRFVCRPSQGVRAHVLRVDARHDRVKVRAW